MQRKNQHLLWRAGFGIAPGQLSLISELPTSELYSSLKKASAKKPDYIDVADDHMKGLWLGLQEAGRRQRQEMDKDQRRDFQKKNRESIRSLNLYWLDEMAASSAQLREKVSLFWHGHFACRNLNVFFQQQLLDVIRRNALGSFRDMLHEVSKTAAMLNFLNNNQNRKAHPNENFAREVMELFTLGRGHYTEQDVKEAARAFTGWGANIKGEFVFRRGQHDNGSKTILGISGNLSGEDVLDILLGHRQTAYHITEKIYKFFVSEHINRERVVWLGDRFYSSGYDISALMDDIFTSSWFYDEENIGSRIKSPVELLAGMQRLLPMRFENDEVLLLVQRLLGQVLFYPPNVAGWPGGKSWIDSTTLITRLRLPMLIDDREDLLINPKDDDDQMMGRSAGLRNRLRIKAEIDWKSFLIHYETIPREDLVNSISEVLLQTRAKPDLNVISSYADASSREKYVRSATLQLMCTPEYQLC